MVLVVLCLCQAITVSAMHALFHVDGREQCLSNTGSSGRMLKAAWQQYAWQTCTVKPHVWHKQTCTVEKQIPCGHTWQCSGVCLMSAKEDENSSRLRVLVSSVMPSSTVRAWLCMGRG